MLEKTPFSSKKFLAYLLSELTWKAIIIIALFVWRGELSSVTPAGWWFMFAVVVTAGFLEVAFIGGQAWLDKYVRVASIAANGGKNED